MRLTLTQRLSLVFAVLLLVCCGTSAWMQVRSNQMHEQEVVQGLSRDLAQHIASDTVLMDTKGLMPGAVRDLFSQLMLVNPSVEVYLLDTEGKIVGSAAPEGRIRRERVDLAPIQRLLRATPCRFPATIHAASTGARCSAPRRSRSMANRPGISMWCCSAKTMIASPNAVRPARR